MIERARPLAADEARRELARRELARRNFAQFCDYAYHGWPGALHLTHLALTLQEVERYMETDGRAGIGRLMVFMPPRHWKSSTASVAFPAWVLGRLPDARVIVTSYNGALAAGFSRRARNLVMDELYRNVFGDRSGASEPIAVSEDTRSVEQWDIAGHIGGMVAAGVGGGLTGKGAHLLIIDDPHRDRAEAESKTQRDAVWDWYTSTAYTRLEHGGAVVLIMTRWHHDDLAGRLLTKGADKWHVLSFPALAETGDELAREPGAALWPDKYPVEELERIHAVIGHYDFDALYQQRPRRLEGNLIRAHKIQAIDRELVPNELNRARYWDLAVSGRETADWLAGALCGLAPDGRRYILDVQRVRGPWADARARIVDAMLHDDAAIPQGIETAGQQAGYFQELQRDAALTQRAIVGVNPRDLGSKDVRANLWASRIEDGLVYMVRGPWNDDFILEALEFPKGAHDDQVDAVSGAFQMLGAGRVLQGDLLV